MHRTNAWDVRRLTNDAVLDPAFEAHVALPQGFVSALYLQVPAEKIQALFTWLGYFLHASFGDADLELYHLKSKWMDQKELHT